MAIRLRRQLKEGYKWGLRKAFLVGQRVGLDILPRHFYSSIPDLRELQTSSGWREPMSMIGVAGAGLDEQLAFAGEIRAPLEDRLPGDVWPRAAEASGEPGYGVAEADCLYCFVASKRPRRIVQLGCGTSTAVILRAAAAAGYTPNLACIEPYPSAYLRRIDAAGQIELVPEKAQAVPLERLTGLGEGDLLFVDSTHTVKVGSEVNRIILEVLPRLAPGVYVQFHDIHFPYDYPRRLLETMFFATESTLLHAFLIGNHRYTIRLCLSMLHYERPEELRRLWPNYRPQKNDQGLRASREGHFPSAIYLEVVDESR